MSESYSESLLELETAICGTLLRDGNRVGEAAAALRAEDFTNGVTRAIFGAICKLHFAGQNVDRISVQHELGEDYGDFLREAEHHVAPDLMGYCSMQRESSRLMAIREAATGLNFAQTMSEADAIMDRLHALTVDRPGVRVVSMAEALNGFFDRLGEAKPRYLDWGMDALNKALFIQPGDFVVIGGYPSSGKTLISIQFALKLSESHRVGYYSLETGDKKLTDRVLCHASGVELRRIKTRELDEADMKALNKAAERLYRLPVDWIPASGMSARDIRATALNLKHEIVFVDYLQIVSSRKRDRYEQVTEISQNLAQMAKANGIAVIALAQLSRPEKVKGKTVPPGLSSLRESGQIEQDADAVLLMHPVDYFDNRSDRVLRLLKNKEGSRAELMLSFDGAKQTMTPRPPSAGEQYRATMKAIKQAARQDQVTFEELPDNGEPLPF